MQFKCNTSNNDAREMLPSNSIPIVQASCVDQETVQEAPPLAASCASCVLALQEHLFSIGTPSRALSI